MRKILCIISVALLALTACTSNDGTTFEQIVDWESVE